MDWAGFTTLAEELDLACWIDGEVCEKKADYSTFMLASWES
jgi:hypothetical protein